MAALACVLSLLFWLGTAAAQPAPERKSKDTANQGAHAGHRKRALPGVVSLDVYVDGSRVHLLTADRAAGTGEAGVAKPRLSYRRSIDGGATWSAPVALGQGQPAPDPIKRGNDAQIVAAGDRLVAVWTTGAATKMGRGPLAAAVSQDGGRTRSPGPSPSDDPRVLDHAFVDLAADEAGAFHAVWLDNRGGPDAGKGLRYARSTDGGLSWSANATLDERCCECCWNAIQTLPGGRVNVLYRDRDPRDMALIASPDGGQKWGKPVTVGAFGWDFNGCPHVGGALAGGAAPAETQGDAPPLYAVVWTARGGSDLGVFALASRDGGRSWGAPAPLGGPQATRPDLAHADGRAVAVWDAFIDGGNAIFAAESTDEGLTWSSPTRLSERGASATHARVIPLSNGFRVFWTEQRPGKPTSWTTRLLK